MDDPLPRAAPRAGRGRRRRRRPDFARLPEAPLRALGRGICALLGRVLRLVLEPMIGRRPLKTRGRAWAKALARWLSMRPVAPNTISIFSLVLAAGAGACFLILPHATRPVQVFLLLLAAGLIQLRLLANMLDGLVAVEGGRKTATGDLFNEVPDRFADILILASAGYALTWLGTLGITFGWLVALLSVLSAYVRVFGGNP